VRGKTRVSSVPATLELDTKNIQALAVDPRGGATVARITETSGRVYESVSDLTAQARFEDENLNEQSAIAYLPLRIGGKGGGVVLELNPEKDLGIRSVSRADPKGTVFTLQTADGSIDGSLEDLVLDTDTFPHAVVLIASCLRDGFRTRLALPARQLKAIHFDAEISSGRRGARVEFYGASDAVTVVEGVREFSFRRVLVSAFNDSEIAKEIQVKDGALTLNVQTDDVARLDIEGTRAALVLKNGDTVKGTLALDDGRPFAIVGKTSLTGFPARACLLLTEILAAEFTQSTVQQPQQPGR
jgi:hypothetical protein